MENLNNSEYCLLCGNDKHTTIYKFKDLPKYKQIGEERDIVKCSECSLIYCHPRNLEESMLDIYENNYWQDYQTQVGEKEIKERVQDFESISKERMNYIERFKKSGKFLDVGCSMGLQTKEVTTLTG